MQLSIQQQQHFTEVIRQRFSIPEKWPICLAALEFFADNKPNQKPIPAHSDEELMEVTNFTVKGHGHSVSGLGMVEWLAEKTTSPTVLQLLAQHPQWTVLMRVASNRHTEVAVLKTLAKHWQESVRHNANYGLEKKQDNG